MRKPRKAKVKKGRPSGRWKAPNNRKVLAALKAEREEPISPFLWPLEVMRWWMPSQRT